MQGSRPPRVKTSSHSPFLVVCALVVFAWGSLFSSLFSAGAVVSLGEFLLLSQRVSRSWVAAGAASGHLAADCALALSGFLSALSLWRSVSDAPSLVFSASALTPRALFLRARRVLALRYIPYVVGAVGARWWAEEWTSCQPAFANGFAWVERALGIAVRCPHGATLPTPLAGIPVPRGVGWARILTLRAPDAAFEAQAAAAWLWPLALAIRLEIYFWCGAAALLHGVAGLGVLAERAEASALSSGGRAAPRAAVLCCARRLRRVSTFTARLVERTFLLALLLALGSSLAYRFTVAPEVSRGVAFAYTPRAVATTYFDVLFTPAAAHGASFAVGALAGYAARSAVWGTATSPSARVVAVAAGTALVLAFSYDSTIFIFLLPEGWLRRWALAATVPGVAAAFSAVVTVGFRSPTVNSWLSAGLGGSEGLRSIARATAAAFCAQPLVSYILWVSLRSNVRDNMPVRVVTVVAVAAWSGLISLALAVALDGVLRRFLSTNDVPLQPLELARVPATLAGSTPTAQTFGADSSFSRRRRLPPPEESDGWIARGVAHDGEGVTMWHGSVAGLRVRTAGDELLALSSDDESEASGFSGGDASADGDAEAALEVSDDASAVAAARVRGVARLILSRLRREAAAAARGRSGSVLLNSLLPTLHGQLLPGMAALLHSYMGKNGRRTGGGGGTAAAAAGRRDPRIAIREILRATVMLSMQWAEGARAPREAAAAVTREVADAVRDAATLVDPDLLSVADGDVDVRGFVLLLRLAEGLLVEEEAADEESSSDEEATAAASDNESSEFPEVPRIN